MDKIREMHRNEDTEFNEAYRRTEREVRNLFSDIRIAVIDKQDFNPDVFAQVQTKATYGIGVYYPIFQDGSCASPVYVEFRLAKDKIIMERANDEEIQDYEKERLKLLLRTD